jgi:hypothetical protein
MLYLSGQPDKEVHYEDSIYREQRFSVLLSVIVAFGHESHFHGPLFSTLMTLGPQWDRHRRWTLEQVIYVSLLMVLDAAPTLKERFDNARQSTVAMFPGRKRPGRTYQGYVKARRQISRRQIRITKRTLRRYHRRIAGSFWRRHGWLAFSADGTRIELPRTSANEKAFGCAGRDKSAPQLALTSLYHLGTGLPWAWRIGPGTESEQVHLRRMIGRLPRGSLLVADAGFTSFDLLWALSQRHVEVLVRMGSHRTLLTGVEDARVQVKGEWVWLWPKQKQAQYPPLTLRLIRIEQANHTPMCLATSVLDEQALTDRQIGQFYRMRWGQEVFHRSFKQTLQQHTMRSGSPGEARRELDWALMAYLILGFWNVQAQIEAHRDPLSWSVAQSLRIVRGAMRRGGGPGRRGPLVTQLRRAVKDSYVRTGLKAIRPWPRKKRDHPPGLPKLREATLHEKHYATTLYERIKRT